MAGAADSGRPLWRRRGEGPAGPPSPGPQQGRRNLSQLTSLGIFPGEEITLLQRSPVYVIRIGGTTLALDEDMAACIRVRRSARA